MKSQVLKYVVGAGILGSGLFFFQNCAPTKFAENQGLNKGEVCVVTSTEDCVEDPTATPTPPGTTPTPGGPTPTPTPGGPTPTPTPPGPTPTPTATPAGEVFPKMSVSAPTCMANTMCPVTFALVRTGPNQKALSFFWKTHDESYMTNPMHARPNVDYVPTSGTINFAANETSKTVYIQSLNISQSTRIPFQWWNCIYGGAGLDCSALK